MINISWAQLLAGAFALAVAMAGAGFTVSRLASDSFISAMQLQTKLMDDRIRTLQDELAACQKLSAGVKEGPDPRISGDTSKIAITFKRPADGARVPQFVDVEYSVTGSLPKGYRPVLFVKDPLGQYWSWGTSTSSQHPDIQIGVAVDTGRQFEIGVLITKEKTAFGKVSRSLPEGLAYQFITVTRN